MPEMLASAPKLPDGCEQLWADFLVLHDSRGSSGFGPSRITASDLMDFQRLHGAHFEGWQIDAIRKADNAFLAHYAAQAKREAKQ